MLQYGIAVRLVGAIQRALHPSESLLLKPSRSRRPLQAQQMNAETKCGTRPIGPVADARKERLLQPPCLTGPAPALF
jgi:hypothetical protein